MYVNKRAQKGDAKQQKLIVKRYASQIIPTGDYDFHKQRPEVIALQFELIKVHFANIQRLKN